MKMKTCVFVAMHVLYLFIAVSFVHAWSGEASFDQMSRETMLRRASEMTNFSWTPYKQIKNQTSPNYPYLTYSPGTVYDGEPYCFYSIPAQNWSDFYSAVNNTTGGNTVYGNECSSFVSIAWGLPKRYNTTAFDCDADNKTTICGNYNPATDDFVTSLGAAGSGANVDLRPGDAFVLSGSHIILFESYWYDVRGTKIGINAYEQTTAVNKRAVYRKEYWTWDRLVSYRPIRRNKIDEGNYEFVTKWGGAGTLSGLFNFPMGIHVDSAGKVYVADTGNDRLQIFTDNGVFLSQLGATGVCGNGNNQFCGISDVETDISGNIYAVDASSVRKFAGDGTFLSKWGSSKGTGNGQFDGINGITVDKTGNFYVTDGMNDRVQKLTSNGTYLTQWGTYGAGNRQFFYPYGIAVDMFNNIYVSDYQNQRIQKFNSDTTFNRAWGSQGFSDGLFNYPAGVTVDLSGNVYVADVNNARIQKFGSNGDFLTKWGAYGVAYDNHPENGNFNLPFGVAVDSALNVYVADTYNNRIQKFKPVSLYPTRPLSLTATAISSNQIRIDWTDNSNNESGFNIVRKTGLRGTYEVIAQDVSANATTYTDTVPSSGTYFYTVYAKNGGLYSAYSNEASATAKTAVADIMDVPSGTYEYTYDLISAPILNLDPSASKPSAFANTISSGAGVSVLNVSDPYYGTGLTDGTLTFRVAFLPFAAPVDIYVGVYAPAIDPLYWWYDSDNAGQPNTTGIAAIWRENTIGPIDEVIFADMPVSSIPPAPYFFYTVVVPAGDTSFSNYYLWDTSFEVRPRCTDLPTMIPRSTWAYFSTLQLAFNGVFNGETIQSEAQDFVENPDFNRNVSATLKGGYYCGYTMSPSHSVIKGTLTISNGTVTIENIVLK